MLTRVRIVAFASSFSASAFASGADKTDSVLVGAKLGVAPTNDRGLTQLLQMARAWECRIQQQRV